MKNTNNVVRTLCEIGIIAALGFVFDELQGILFKGIFINGGSIGFAMIAVLVMAYRRGWLPAILTGLLMGLMDVATSAYILHPVQLLLDYILPYAVVGIAGLLRPFFIKSKLKTEKILWLISGAIIGGLLKFCSHYLAGIIYWANPEYFAWNLNEMNPYLYCFVYNIAFIGPSIILCAGLLVVMYLTAPKILLDKPIIRSEQSNKEDILSAVISSMLILGGLAIFIIFLIKYIKSFSDYTDGSAYGYDFDPDSMVIFVLGFFLLILGINSFISYLVKRFSYLRMSISFLAIVSASLIYDIARLIKMYVKGKNPHLYWIWFIFGMLTVLIGLTVFTISLIHYKRDKKDVEVIDSASQSALNGD